MITQKRKFVKKILISGCVLICACTSPVTKTTSSVLDLLNNNRDYKYLECSSDLFNEVEDFRIGLSDKKDFEFAKILERDSLINNTCYKLFYLKSKSKELLGYWGERNDSILYVPYSPKACVINEYLIYQRDLDSYFNLKKNSCVEEDVFDSVIGNGYSYKRIVSGDGFVSLAFYVNPLEVVDITQSAHYFDSAPLILNIDYVKGVSLFMYDFDLDKQPIIPWVEQLLPAESDL
jgi:hypothetical protein